MSTHTPFMDASRLEKVADTLASYVTTLSVAGFSETASLLRIAHLDLVSRVHEITDEELRAVASLADRNDPVTDRAAAYDLCPDTSETACVRDNWQEEDAVPAHDDREAGGSVCAVWGLPAGKGVEEIRLEGITSRTLKQAVDVWRERARGRRYPSRADMTPRSMVSFLREVSLLHLTGGDGEFAYRVSGDATVLAWGRSLAGFDTATFNAFEAGAGDMLRRLCRLVARRRAPVAVRGILSPGRAFITHETVYLPLGPDASTVDHILAVSSFTPD